MCAIPPLVLCLSLACQHVCHGGALLLLPSRLFADGAARMRSDVSSAGLEQRGVGLFAARFRVQRVYMSNVRCVYMLRCMPFMMCAYVQGLCLCCMAYLCRCNVCYQCIGLYADWQRVATPLNNDDTVSVKYDM